MLQCAFNKKMKVLLQCDNFAFQHTSAEILNKQADTFIIPDYCRNYFRLLFLKKLIGH